MRLSAAGVSLSAWSGWIGEIAADYATGRGQQLRRVVFETLELVQTG